MGALIGMGIPEYEAKRYEGRLQKGGILLSVHCDTSEEIKRAKEIFARTGGETFLLRARPQSRPQIVTPQTQHAETAKFERTFMCSTHKASLRFTL